MPHCTSEAFFFDRNSKIEIYEKARFNYFDRAFFIVKIKFAFFFILDATFYA
ncbi:hypothetical protein BB050_03615 [Flavobacterium anhuiense]|uniref:Uncharacterized protein n=1 Tax=Flavobacterium anhuiense TaxID=459526 RepID=A0AAC9D2R6_9FLAO|nr:hypothetical protein BB050_03615 [Flavobacterium anhuiense]